MNREIEQLIHNAIHDELSRADALRLSEWITASKDNARAYYRIVIAEKAIERCLNRDSVIEVSALVDQAEQDIDLADLRGLAESEDLAAAALVQLPNQPPPTPTQKPPRRRAATAEPRHTPSPHEPVLSLMGVHVYRGSGVSLSRLALAAAFACAAVVGLMVWLNTPDAEPSSVAEIQAPAPEPNDDNPAIAARVVSMVDVRWNDGQTRPIDHAVLIGDSIVIDQGYLTLRSARGAQITVQGPCSMTAVDANRFYIAQGRLIANVPPSAIYFALDTPTARIVDYGTEFGVQVDGQGNTDAVVMTGLIELAEAERETPGEAPKARRKVQLSAGWSSSVTANKGLQDHAVAFDINHPDHFAHELMSVSDPTFRFRQAVIQSKPIVYWTFEQSIADHIDNLIKPGKYALKRHGQVELVDNTFGKAARLINRPNENDYLRSSQSIEALSGQNQYSVSLWFKSDAPQNGRLLGIATRDNRKDIYQHIAVLETISDTVSIHNQAAPPNSARFLHRDPPGNDSTTGNNVYATGIQPGRWYHMVAVKHLDQMAIYLNGQRIDTVADTGSIIGNPDVMIGLSHDLFRGVAWDDEQRRPFRGLIDEVAIYDRSLTAEEIEEQYRLGSQ